MNQKKPTVRLKSSSSSRSKYPFISSTPKGLFIILKIQPRASRNQVDGVQNGALKVRLTAPPIEGEANRALLDFLSDILRLRKSALSIEAGLKSREKRVKVEGIKLEELEELFSEKFRF